jgi:hypothetical protein
MATVCVGDCADAPDRFAGGNSAVLPATTVREAEHCRRLWRNTGTT